VIDPGIWSPTVATEPIRSIRLDGVPRRVQPDGRQAHRRARSQIVGRARDRAHKVATGSRTTLCGCSRPFGGPQDAVWRVTDDLFSQSPRSPPIEARPSRTPTRAE